MHSGGGSGRKELPETAAAIRKGPWMVEEDEVLIDFVKKHGPRDWSSIRSKGLLPRTGKSCRLRWVNKLKPDLKTGCKFSAEEERIVIDLQARFGNKWARIASNLPGRTDNDVKNFWSTRQKRLARLLQTPLPVRSQRRQGKAPMAAEVPNFEPIVNSCALLPYTLPCPDLIPFTEENSNGQCSHVPYIEDPDSAKTLQMLNLDATALLIEPAIANSELCLLSSTPPQPPFDHSLLELPLLPEGQDFIPEFGDMNFPGHFGCAENSQAMQLHMAPTFFDVDVGGNDIKIEQPGTPESFFGDFPADMFDSLDQPPPS